MLATSPSAVFHCAQLLSFEHKLHAPHKRDASLSTALVLNLRRGAKEFYSFVPLPSPLSLILVLFLSIDTVTHVFS